ncbi:hypothetical protein RFI_29740, partial [Reticulomyxa filosa]
NVVEGFWKCITEDCYKELKNDCIIRPLQFLLCAISNSNIYSTIGGTLLDLKTNIDDSRYGRAYTDILWSLTNDLFSESEPLDPFIVIDYKSPNVLDVFNNMQDVLQKTWDQGCIELGQLMDPENNGKFESIINIKKTMNLKVNRSIRQTIPKEESEIQSKTTDEGINCKCTKDNGELLLLRHYRKTLPWCMYTKTKLHDKCDYYGIRKSGDMEDMIERLNEKVPRHVMNPSTLCSHIQQIITYPRFVWMEIDKIGDEDKVFNIKVHKIMKALSFKQAMLELLKISTYAIKLERNKRQLRVDVPKRQKRKLKNIIGETELNEQNTTNIDLRRSARLKNKQQITIIEDDDDL